MKYYLKPTRRSALSDTKCEAQAEHFISDKARPQVQTALNGLKNDPCLSVYWRRNFQNQRCLSRENQS